MATSTSITEPTIVPGPNLPGVSDFANTSKDSPLSKLYSSKFKTNIFQFPSDLSKENRGHVIMFTTRVPTEKSQQGLTADSLRRLANAGTALDDRMVLESPVPPPSITGQAAEILKELSRISLQRQDGDNIALYVPDTVNVQYAARYTDVSLTEAIGKPLFLAQGVKSIIDSVASGEGIAGKISNVANDPFMRSLVASGLGGALGTSNLPELALAGIGYAFNPQLQVLFSSIGFRTFQFDFILTPKNQLESAQIQNIIRTFKMAAAPTFEPGFITQASMFLKVPDTFKIQFLFNGEQNLNVNRIGECVLESIDVDYAPNGWSTFNDGSAVQTRLTLQFKEIEIVDKLKIKEGY